MIAELMGAKIVVFRELSSKRCVTVAKSLVKPANMLIERSLPSTSERITVSSSAGFEVTDESSG